MSEEEQLKQMAAQMRAAEYKGLSEEEIEERERQKEMRRKKNIEVLEDTLNILEKGSYQKDGEEIRLHFTQEQMKEAKVFWPDDLGSMCGQDGDADETKTESVSADKSAPCAFGCENKDSLALAQERYEYLRKNGEDNPRILVLNMASATKPGGQTRNGASAQEEDLCRRTSLLLSLESGEAKKYYDYNNARKTKIGSHAIIFSPNVEVIRDYSSEMLAEPFSISVMSCAAPMVRLGLEGMSQQEYENMLCKRIEGMLCVAASQGCRRLILGAFGCGVFGNDAAVVSDMFDRAIRDFKYAGATCDQLFGSIDFAVLCRPGKDYNYREFCRNFVER